MRVPGRRCAQMVGQPGLAVSGVWLGYWVLLGRWVWVGAVVNLDVSYVASLTPRMARFGMTGEESEPGKEGRRGCWERGRKGSVAR
jgi:hypothetical protein